MIRKMKGNVTTHIIFTWNPKVMEASKDEVFVYLN